MQAPGNEINTTVMNTELLHFLLDESSLYALLDRADNIIWMREDTGYSTGKNFREYHSLVFKNDKYYSEKDGKCFNIELIPGQPFKYVNLEKPEVVGEIKGLAHDFNNIFSGILNQLDTLKDKLSLDNEAFKSLDNIEKQAVRAIEILETALNKKENTRLKQKVKPEIVFDEALSALAHKFPPNLKINKQVDYNTPLNLNRGEFFRVLLNLVNNAIEAADKDTTIINFHIYPEGNNVIIKIADNGCGISAENIQKIFDDGFSTKKRLIDSGIGLNITKKMIEDEGGSISVQSDEGAGTRFIISLPAPRNKKIVNPGEQKTILIADDEADMRELLAELFSDFNYKVIQANNGIEAFLHYNNHPEINLAIVDKKMPEMNGLEFIEKVRKSDSDTPIILASGSMSESEKRMLAFLHIDKILEKPYKFEKLLELTEMLINA